MNDRLAGILLGTAVGDALGLPTEPDYEARSERCHWFARKVLPQGFVG